MMIWVFEDHQIIIDPIFLGKGWEGTCRILQLVLQQFFETTLHEEDPQQY